MALAKVDGTGKLAYLLTEARPVFWPRILADWRQWAAIDLLASRFHTKHSFGSSVSFFRQVIDNLREVYISPSSNLSFMMVAKMDKKAQECETTIFREGTLKHRKHLEKARRWHTQLVLQLQYRALTP
jgi:hypothetical protein